LWTLHELLVELRLLLCLLRGERLGELQQLLDILELQWSALVDDFLELGPHDLEDWRRQTADELQVY
jgi:hypothetical protein